MTRLLVESSDGDATDVGVVAVVGDVDMATAPAMTALATEALFQHGASELQLDLARMTFIDSSGIAALLAIHRDAEQRGKRLVLLNPQRQARTVIGIMGLASTFHLDAATET